MYFRMQRASRWRRARSPRGTGGGNAAPGAGAGSAPYCGGGCPELRQDPGGEDLGGCPAAGGGALEQERQHIRQEAEAEKELARADGYRQGYGEGLRQARVEGAAQIEEHRKQEAERIRSFLEQAAAARDSLLEQAQNELCELSLAVAEKVIHISLRTSRDVIARMIQVATEKLKRREWVHIYVGI